MFDVFGNFDSVEELNACAKGLLEEQDLEHLKVLAEEKRDSRWNPGSI